MRIYTANIESKQYNGYTVATTLGDVLTRLKEDIRAAYTDNLSVSMFVTHLDDCEGKPNTIKGVIKTTNIVKDKKGNILDFDIEDTVTQQLHVCEGAKALRLNLPINFQTLTLIV